MGTVMFGRTSASPNPPIAEPQAPPSADQAHDIVVDDQVLGAGEDENTGGSLQQLDTNPSSVSAGTAMASQVNACEGAAHADAVALSHEGNVEANAAPSVSNNHGEEQAQSEMNSGEGDHVMRNVANAPYAATTLSVVPGLRIDASAVTVVPEIDITSEGLPPLRDRAYTYVRNLPVSSVRRMCRDAHLKQFGRKDQSQPRLFWAADSAIEAANPQTDVEEALLWSQALPGLSSWLSASHRSRNTNWIPAPERTERPADYHTYFAAPLASSLVIGDTADPNSSPKKPRAPPAKVEELPAIPIQGEPTMRDKAYTYVASLPVTVVRRYCKLLDLKQFGKKKESQSRLFWHWANAYMVNPARNAIHALPQFAEWLEQHDGDPAPSSVVWLQAPDASERPPPSPGRRPRRRRFLLSEFARLSAVLVRNEEMRQGFVGSVLAVQGGAREEGDSEKAKRAVVNAYWRTKVASMFNDNNFAPEVSLYSCVAEVDARTLPPVTRTGDELRQQFVETRALFVRAYVKWVSVAGENSSPNPEDFENFLLAIRRPVLPAPEKRALILFQVLRCGQDDEHTNVLRYMLLDLPTHGVENGFIAAIEDPPSISNSSPAPGTLQEDRICTSVNENPDGETPFPQSAPALNEEPVARTLGSNLGDNNGQEDLAAVENAEEGQANTVSATYAVGLESATHSPPTRKRPRSPVQPTFRDPGGPSQVEDRPDKLTKILEESVADAKKRKMLLRVEQERAILDAIRSGRMLDKELARDGIPYDASLRVIARKRIAKLSEVLQDIDKAGQM